MTLLRELTQLAGDPKKTDEWPKTPRKLSGILRRLIPPLADVGIEVEPPGETDKTRTWHIRKPPIRPEQPDGKPLKNQGLGDVGDAGGILHTTGSADPHHGNGRIPADCKTPPRTPEPPATAKTSNVNNGLVLGDRPGSAVSGISTAQKPEGVDQVCAHCGELGIDVVLWDWHDGRKVPLHDRCADAWDEAQRKQRLRVVGGISE